MKESVVPSSSLNQSPCQLSILWDFVHFFRLWDFVLWDSVLWDFVRRDFVLWDFALWDSVRIPDRSSQMLVNVFNVQCIGLVGVSDLDYVL